MRNNRFKVEREAFLRIGNVAIRGVKRGRAGGIDMIYFHQIVGHTITGNSAMASSGVGIILVPASTSAKA